MAVMSSNERAACTTAYMADKSKLREAIATITKAQLRAAVDAVDQWADDNAAAFNSAIPLAARNALTSQQKAELLLFVIRRRTNWS